MFIQHTNKQVNVLFTHLYNFTVSGDESVGYTNQGPSTNDVQQMGIGVVCENSDVQKIEILYFLRAHYSYVISIYFY